MPVPCSHWLGWWLISKLTMAREEHPAMSTQHPLWGQFPLEHRERLLQVLVAVSLKQLPTRQEGNHDSTSQDSHHSSRPSRVHIRAAVHPAAGALRHRE